MTIPPRAYDLVVIAFLAFVVVFIVANWPDRRPS
jgi:hypothetical protein